MKQWWASLQPREKQLVSLAAIFVALALFYSLIWQPISQAVIEQKQKVQTQQQLLSWVQTGTAQVRAFQQQTGKAVSANGTLTQWANQSARAQKITISRMQPQGESLQLWVDEVPFNDLIAWLETMHTRYGVIVENFDVSLGDEPGMVKVRRLQIGKPI